MTIAIDGSATGVSASGTQSTASAVLTTSNAGDIIVALIANDGFGSYSTAASSLAGTGITGWTLRGMMPMGGNGSGGSKSLCEVWYGYAAAALTGVTITATTHTSSEGISLMVFGISGADTTTMTDNNSALPSFMINEASGATVTQRYSTSNANDLVLAIDFNSNGTVDSTFPSGYTEIATINKTGSNYNATISASYKVLSAAQTNTAVTQTIAGGSTNTGPIGGVMFLDGIRQAGSPANPSTSPPFIDQNFGTWSQRSSGASSFTFNNGQYSNQNNVAAAPNGTTMDTANEAVVCIICYETNSNTPTTVSSVALTGNGSGLSWTKQTSILNTTAGAFSMAIEVWSAPLSAVLNLSGGVNLDIVFGATVDSCGAFLFAVRGLHNAASPLDLGAFPATAFNTTTTTPPTVTYSTSVSQTLSVAVTGNTNNNGALGAASGWTEIGDNPNGGGTQGTNSWCSYKVNTTTQTGATYADSSTGTSLSWTELVISFTSLATNIQGSWVENDNTDFMMMKGFSGVLGTMLARYRYAPPLASNFTQKLGTNSVNPTCTDTSDRGLQVNYGANATSSVGLRAVMKPLNAASNQTITARIEMPDWGYNYTQIGMGFSDGTKYVLYYQIINGEGSMGVQTWTSNSGGNSTLVSTAGCFGPGMEWWQMKLVSGHPQTFSFSSNGQDWIELYNTAITSISTTFTPTYVGFLMMVQHSGGTPVVSGTNEFYMNCLYYSDPDISPGF